MARPKKAVVDYFPHYVNHGKTLFIIEQKFGNDGYAFWFKLLELLGSSEHHFLDLRNSDVWEFLLAKTRLDGVTVDNILDKLAELDSIDAELWEHRVVWSSNFVDNLSFAYKRREVSVYTKADLLGLCMQKPRSVDVSADINPAIKEKEIKEKGRETETPPPKSENSLWRETTDKLIDEWETLYTHRPDPAFIKDIRSRVYESCSSGQKADAIRQALKQIAEGAHPLSFGRLVTEAANGRASPGSPEHQRKAIQCDEECGRYECGTQKGDVLFDYCIHCKRHQNRDARAHVP